MKKRAGQQCDASTLIPRPRLAFRIGLVGVRDLNDHERRNVDQQLRVILRDIRDIIQENDPDWGYARAHPTCFLIDSLAEGVDQIGAVIALELGFEIIAPIPFAAQNYVEHFVVNKEFHRQGFEELVSNQHVRLIELNLREKDDTERSSAYQDAATILMQNSDILIAVVRQDQEIRAGGTMDTIERAVNGLIPVIALELSGRNECKFLGRGEASIFSGVKWEEMKGNVRIAILNILTPHRFAEIQGMSNIPDRSKSRGDQKRAEEAIRRRERYFMETPLHYYRVPRSRGTILGWLYSCAWHLCDGIGRICCKMENNRAQPEIESSSKRHQPTIAREAESTIQAIRDEYEKQYGHTDHLAIVYMELYRGAFILNYLLGASAVLFALLSYLNPARELFWILLEVFSLTLIAVNFTLDRKYQWHTRGLEYRFLAENFRLLLFIAPLFRRLPGTSIGAHHRYGDPTTSWMTWYLNAVIRGNGVTGKGTDQQKRGERTVVMSSAYLDCLVREITGNWLVDQGRYHGRTARKFHFTRSFLQGFTILLFIVVALTVAFHLIDVLFLMGNADKTVGVGITGWREHWLTTVLVAVLPAFIAAIHSILIQGEFERLEERSEEMKNFLWDQSDRIRKLDGSRPHNFSIALGAAAQEIGRSMLQELADWRIMYLNRSTELT